LLAQVPRPLGNSAHAGVRQMKAKPLFLFAFLFLLLKCSLASEIDFFLRQEMACPVGVVRNNSPEDIDIFPTRRGVNIIVFMVDGAGNLIPDGVWQNPTIRDRFGFCQSHKVKANGERRFFIGIMSSPNRFKMQPNQNYYCLGIARFLLKGKISRKITPRYTIQYSPYKRPDFQLNEIFEFPKEIETSFSEFIKNLDIENSIQQE
jgi:hypothetical protein